MTQEQYNRAVEIRKRIEELENAKHYLREVDSNCRYSNYVRSLISKFRIMTNNEIDNEIEKLKKEIEEL